MIHERRKGRPHSICDPTIIALDAKAGHPRSARARHSAAPRSGNLGSIERGRDRAGSYFRAGRHKALRRQSSISPLEGSGGVAPASYLLNLGGNQYDVTELVGLQQLRVSL